MGENPSGMTLDPVVIYSVSTRVSTTSVQASGSLQGGTYLYIRASGLDQTASNNQVMIGPYECNIPEKGINEVFLTCKTSKPFDNNRLYNLKVVVKVNGKLPSACSVGWGCLYSYKYEQTPFLRLIRPNSGPPESMVSWIGLWRVPNTNEIKRMKIGDINCERFTVFEGLNNLNDDQNIDSWQWKEVEVVCRIASDSAVGIYNISADITWGLPYNKYESYSLTADGQSWYQYMIVPEINKISSNLGSPFGQIITIQGRGFGSNTSDLQVMAGGLECNIQSVQNDQIQCEVEAGNSATQSGINQFYSGSGWQYSLIDNSQRDLHGPQDVREQIVTDETFFHTHNLILEERIIGSTDLEINQQYSAAWIRGYFKAPRTGVYNFWISGAEAEVWLNTDPLSADRTSSNYIKILNKCVINDNRDYWNSQNSCNDLHSVDLNLVEGNLYWIDVYSYNTWRQRWSLTLSVETPSLSDDLTFYPLNSMYQAQKISILTTTEKEIWSIKIFDFQDPFQIQFTYIDPVTRLTTWDRISWVSKTWQQWQDWEFRDKLDWCAGNYNTSLEAYTLDSSGQRCGDNCLVAGREWVITFNQYRSEGQMRMTPKLTAPSNKQVISRLQSPSPPVRGYFTLSYDGTPIKVWNSIINDWSDNIQYDQNSQDIVRGFAESFHDLDLRITSTNRPDDGQSFTFYFLNPSKKGDLPPMTSTNFLNGGTPGTSPTIEITISNEPSNRPFYEPIPNDMLLKPSNTSQIIVKSIQYGILSRCSGNCEYVTDSNQIFSVSSFSISNNVLTLVFPASTQVANENIIIFFAGSQCTNIDATNVEAVTCSLPTNSDNTIQIEAGSQKPIVYQIDYGYSDTNALTPIDVPLTLTSISPSTGGINGGDLITLTGTGFPINDHSNLLVSVGHASSSKIISVSNTQIIIQSPKMVDPDDTTGIVKIQVTYNQLQTDITDSIGDFQYSISGIPTIESVTPTSASPVLKQTFTVTGTNFGTILNDLQLHLYNLTSDESIYELNINAATDTQITATLSGGHVGVFGVRIIKTGVGYSIGDVQFEYIVRLQSLTPTQGSIYGGTDITITGENFSLNQVDNNVFIYLGDVSLTCFVLQSNSTSITCRTPPKDPSFNGTVNVVVSAKLIEESTCTGTCTFTYDEGITGTVSELTTTIYSNGDTILVSGTLLDSGSGANVLIGEQTVSATVNSATEIQFVVPDNLEQGSYSAIIQVIDVGFFGIINFDIAFNIQNVTPNQISLGGEIITVEGSGFTVGVDQVMIGSDRCKIIYMSPTTITCHAEQRNQESQQNVIVVHNSTQTAQSSNMLQYLTSKTFTVTSFSPNSTITPTSFTITLSGSSLDNKSLEVYLELTTDFMYKFQGTISGASGTYTATFTNVAAGSYKLQIRANLYGYAQFQRSRTFNVQMANIAISSVSSSYAGGKQLQITGNGWDITNLQKNQIQVCNELCQVLSSTTESSLNCVLPRIQTKTIQNHYRIDQVEQKITNTDEKQYYEYIGTHPSQGVTVSDNQVSTYYNVNQGILSPCWLGYDFGNKTKIFVTKFEYRVRGGIDKNTLNHFYGIRFEGSNDLITWDHYFTVDQTISLGMNNYRPNNITESYRYIRFINDFAVERWKCQFAEVQLFGYLYYANDTESIMTDTICDVNVSVNQKSEVLQSKITYQVALTPILTDINPMYGWQLGGELINLYGTGFGTEEMQAIVLLDGITCDIQTIIDTQITCITGNKGVNNHDPPSIKIIINGNDAMVQNSVIFYYGLKWSNDATWGGEAAPRDGDSVFVPEGQVLIVDQSSPLLNLVVVEGVLIFADGQDLTFDAQYIIIRMGKFLIGLEGRPFTSRLTITMHGNYFGSQLPEFGNKVIGCHHCQLEIHGNPKTPTWTFVNSTLNINDTSLTTTEDVNWEVGDQLIIAPTNFSHFEAEQVQITEINGRVITFTPKLKFRHYSAIETYSNYNFPMLAEVGVLTRKVVIQGDPTDSIKDQYGAHLMLHGKSQEGTLAKIENAEFRYTGQPKIIGRYTIHFHMNGDCSQSYVRGNAVHHSYARVVALHAVSHLRVQNNVGYDVQGHNIFLEDGIETFNVIEYNLLISSRKSSIMLQTDMTVASIWVTHPTNFIRYNHCAGSDFYGLWLEIKENPDGPSATSEICPQGMKVGDFDHNVAHSNVRFGLRFFVLAPRKFPCRDTRNADAPDIYSDNPSIPTTFFNFTGYKNGESGVLAERMGNSIFKGFLIADSYRAAFQTHLANYTKEGVNFTDSLIVGMSTNNGAGKQFHIDARSIGILCPRTENFFAKNITFYNYENLTLVEWASENENKLLAVQGGKSSSFQLSTIVNSSYSNIIRWKGSRQNMVLDLDGTLTGTNVKTYVTPYYQHFDNLIAANQCVRRIDFYDDSVTCSVTLRSIVFRNFIPTGFTKSPLKILDLRSPNITAYGNSNSIEIIERGDGKLSHCAVFAVGQSYNIHWGSGVNWDHLMLQPDYQTEVTDPPIVLRFNYTIQRELFEIKKMIGGMIPPSAEGLYTQSLSLSRLLDNDTYVPNNSSTGCNLGDWYNDIDNRLFHVCINGKAKTTQYEVVDMNGIYCRETCPQPGQTCTKESRIRIFIDPVGPAQWNTPGFALRKRPSATVWSQGEPQEGDDVIIPCEWTMIMNVNFTFGTLYVDGTLKFQVDPQSPQINLFANNIYVRYGKIQAGDLDSPYQGRININLIGNTSSPNLIIDDQSQAGTKVLAVTGELILYGIAPTSVWTVLTSNALIGATSITVASAADWQAGDEIVIGTSSFDSTGDERFIIESINGTTVNLIGYIQFFHYGDTLKTFGPDNANTIINRTYGQFGLDMRARVGHLTRNIKIIGINEDNLGGHLLVYNKMEMFDSVQTFIRGVITLQGVELSNMGQHDSLHAGLHFYQTNIPGDTSKITGCSIHDCNGMCIYGELAHHVLIDNNVIYNGKQFLLKNKQTKDWQISNNIFLLAKFRDPNNPDLTASILMDSSYDPLNDQFKVFGNTAQGSQGLGFSFPGTPCELSANNSFYGNTVGSADQTGVLFTSTQNICYWQGGVAVYHAKKGVIINPTLTTKGCKVEQMILAESKINLILRVGTRNTIINNYWTENVYISGMARPNCPQCYQDIRKCSNNFGYQIAVSTETGGDNPMLKPSNFDVICTSPTVFGSSYFRNSQLSYFKQTYTNLIDCGSNYAVKTNPSGDSSQMGTYLTNVVCNNCDEMNMFKFDNPKPAWMGWFGGCGDVITCTGLKNFLFYDMDGTFFGGAPRQVIPLNDYIGRYLPQCTSYPNMNVYICQTTDFIVLEWDGNGDDRNKLSSAPVLVNNAIFVNHINIFREWEWEGPEPLNKRANSYISLALKNMVYNVSYAGTFPYQLIHRIQQRTEQGEHDLFVIFQYQYNVPLSIQVSVNGVVVPTFSPTSYPNLLNHSTTCGANNYFYENRTIHFVITGDINCKVQITLKNVVRLSLQLTMDPEEIYNTAAQSQFIDRISAFLNIPTNRVRIVGIRINTRRRLLAESASVTILYEVQSDAPASTSASSIAEDTALLASYADQNIESGSLNIGLNAEVESVSFEVITAPVDPSTIEIDDVDQTSEVEESTNNAANTENKDLVQENQNQSTKGSKNDAYYNPLIWVTSFILLLYLN